MLFVLFLLSIIFIDALKQNVPHDRKLNNYQYISHNNMDYELPRWALKHFKKNIIPHYSVHKIRRKKPFISNEDAMYNAVIACKLPLGLLQQPSSI